jgi:hypothetical protein
LLGHRLDSDLWERQLGASPLPVDPLQVVGRRLDLLGRRHRRGLWRLFVLAHAEAVVARAAFHARVHVVVHVVVEVLRVRRLEQVDQPLGRELHERGVHVALAVRNGVLHRRHIDDGERVLQAQQLRQDRVLGVLDPRLVLVIHAWGLGRGLGLGLAVALVNQPVQVEAGELAELEVHQLDEALLVLPARRVPPALDGPGDHTQVFVALRVQPLLEGVRPEGAAQLDRLPPRVRDRHGLRLRERRYRADRLRHLHRDREHLGGDPDRQVHPGQLHALHEPARRGRAARLGHLAEREEVVERVERDLSRLHAGRTLDGRGEDAPLDRVQLDLDPLGLLLGLLRVSPGAVLRHALECSKFRRTLIALIARKECSPWP